MTTPPRELRYQGHRYVLAAKSDLVPAIRKDTGKKVMVAPETLKEQPQEYEPRKLFLDAQHGDAATKRKLLAHPQVAALRRPVTPPNSNDEYKWDSDASHYDDTLLHTMAKNSKSHPDIERAITQHPQAGSVKNLYHNTPLHDLAARGSTEGRKAVLQHPAAAHARTDTGYTPLHAVADSGDSDAVLAAVQHPDAARVHMDGGHTPLHLAAEKARDPKVIKAILDHPDVAKVRDNGGLTPLHLLAGNRSARVAMRDALQRHPEYTKVRGGRHDLTPADMAKHSR